MKTNELTGAALDWAVDKCNFMQHSLESDYCLEVGYAPLYSTDWAHGGPLIEREKLDVGIHTPTHQWCSATHSSANRFARGYGPTPLIAAMRCYVASTLGDNIELPKELT